MSQQKKSIKNKANEKSAKPTKISREQKRKLLIKVGALSCAILMALSALLSVFFTI